MQLFIYHEAYIYAANYTIMFIYSKIHEHAIQSCS